MLPTIKRSLESHCPKRLRWATDVLLFLSLCECPHGKHQGTSLLMYNGQAQKEITALRSRTEKLTGLEEHLKECKARLAAAKKDAKDLEWKNEVSSEGTIHRLAIIHDCLWNMMPVLSMASRQVSRLWHYLLTDWSFTQVLEQKVESLEARGAKMRHVLGSSFLKHLASPPASTLTC